MRKKLLVLCLIFVLCASLFACGKKEGNTVKEPEITVEYLSSEYATRLEKDGAQIILGSISELKKDILTIEEHEAVTEEDDFYFANKNIKTAFELDEDARIVYKTAQKPDGEILSSKSLGPKLADNSVNIYQFYIIDKKIELIIPYEQEKKGEEK